MLAPVLCSWAKLLNHFPAWGAPPARKLSAWTIRHLAGTSAVQLWAKLISLLLRVHTELAVMRAERVCAGSIMEEMHCSQ